MLMPSDWIVLDECWHRSMSQQRRRGVTIAKEIELEDQAGEPKVVVIPTLAAELCGQQLSCPALLQVENTGVQLIRQASAKTNDVAGDGTTTLAYMLREGVAARELEAQVN
eukprot:Skav200882  [mRNA]  locus=scaffold4880:227262:228222:+ [translate_table: standard]